MVVKRGFKMILRARFSCSGQFVGIQMQTRFAALFFDFDDPAELVCIGFNIVVGIVVPGDGVKTRAFGLAASDDKIGHANDGGGVHATAEIGNDGTVGAEITPDGCREGYAEVLLVFSVSAIANSFFCVEVPVPGDDAIHAVFAGPQYHRRTRRDRMNAIVRRQMCSRIHSHPASDVLFTDLERFSGV